jgi:hypothetical protein
MPRAPVYVTKKEFNDYKKEVAKLFRESKVAKKPVVKKRAVKKAVVKA